MSEPIRHLIVDMDGVLWRGETAVAGLAAFFERLERLGIGYVLATNNATRTAAQYVEKLAGMGVSVRPERILTSAEATALYLARHFAAATPVYVVGEAGLRQAVAAQGFRLLTEGDGAAAGGERPVVVAGLSRQVGYEELATAALLIRAGAAFVGTNPDRTLPSERGQLPGAGAILAFLTAASGVEPVVVGKPEPFLFAEALRRLGGGAAETVAVGDRLETDIAGGIAAGLRTALVLSGVATAAEAAHSPWRPDWIFEDVSALAAFLAAERAIRPDLPRP